MTKPLVPGKAVGREECQARNCSGAFPRGLSVAFYFIFIFCNQKHLQGSGLKIQICILLYVSQHREFVHP